MGVEEKLPDRVVVEDDGYAIPAKRAEREYGIKPDVVFIRNDGWSLGAPKMYENIAYELWENDWTQVYDPSTDSVSSIEEYLL